MAASIKISSEVNQALSRASFRLSAHVGKRITIEQTISVLLLMAEIHPDEINELAKTLSEIGAQQT